jgi:hypothetical protein
MRYKELRVVAVITLFSCLIGLNLPAQTAGTLLDVSGIGKAQDGEYFAIVRGHGVVHEGDIVSVATGDTTCRIRIVSIGKTTLEMERVDTVKKELAREEPKSITADTKVIMPSEPRDPFCPVGSDPASI